jgi:hypothetical protein
MSSRAASAFNSRMRLSATASLSSISELAPSVLSGLDHPLANITLGEQAQMRLDLVV